MKKSTNRITSKILEAMEPGDNVADCEIRGFSARCLPSGTITFVYRYVAPTSGVRREMKLGLYGAVTAAEARAQAKIYAGSVAAHLDPAAEIEAKREAGKSFAAVWDDFFKRHASKRGNAFHVKSAMDRLVLPALGNKPIVDVGRGDINRLLGEIEEGVGPSMADHVLAYVRKMLNWYAVQDETFRSPMVKGMGRAHPRRRRTRVLNDQEIAEVWHALDVAEVPDSFRRLVRVALISGQRRSAIACTTADEVKGDRWIIPAARMKLLAEDHLVPCSPALRKLLVEGSGYLFSTDGGKTAFSGFSKSKAAFDHTISVLRQAAGRPPIPSWVLHDLRRTARSILSRYTTPDHAERVLGHVLPGIRRVYDLHEYEAEKREALAKLAAHIDGVVNPPTGKVVQLHPAA